MWCEGWLLCAYMPMRTSRASVNAAIRATQSISLDTGSVTFWGYAISERIFGSTFALAKWPRMALLTRFALAAPTPLLITEAA